MNKKDRQKVFEKFNKRCAYCGCELGKGWHLDHMEAVTRLYDSVRKDVKKKDWRGREYMDNVWTRQYKGMQNPHLDTVENAMPSCQSCNINKHGDTIEQFRAAIQGYLNSLNERMVQYKMAKKYNLVQETGIPVVFYFETFGK